MPEKRKPSGNLQTDKKEPHLTGSLNQSGDVKNQNQGHNVKKEALGPNTKR